MNSRQIIASKFKGDDNVADIGTKPLAMKTFEQQRRRLGLSSGPYESGLSSGLYEREVAELAMSSGRHRAWAEASQDLTASILELALALSKRM